MHIINLLMRIESARSSASWSRLRLGFQLGFRLGLGLGFRLWLRLRRRLRKISNTIKVGWQRSNSRALKVK
jgi:hypothetical protein